jgi:hypothetical protein
MMLPMPAQQRFKRVALYNLAMVPGAEPGLIIVPASLLRSSCSRRVRHDVALNAVARIVTLEPSKQAADEAARQLAAQPGSIHDVVQLLGSSRAAADDSNALLCIYVAARLMTASNSTDKVIQVIAADKGAVAAVVKACSASLMTCARL